VARRSHARRARPPEKEPDRAAVVIYSYYLSDPRPRRETEAYVKAGWKADVLCLRRTADTPKFEWMGGINIYRLARRRRREGKLAYIIQYGYFFFRAFFLLSRLSLTRRYKVVHVHNMPDFLVFTALVPRLLGAKVILDLHDPMPELFSSIYKTRENGSLVKLLKWVERRSASFADLVLTPNLAFQRIFASRSCPADKIRIVMNTPRADIFDPKAAEAVAPVDGADGDFILMYHGLLVERHGLDLAIEALSRLKDRVPRLKLRLFGEPSEYMGRVMKLAVSAGCRTLLSIMASSLSRKLPPPFLPSTWA